MYACASVGAPACLCVRSKRQHSSKLGGNLLLFSLSPLALFLLFLLPLFPHPLLPCLLNEGAGEVLSALFENVITIIMMMIVLMMITVLVKIKGGVSEGVSGSWGEVTSAP